jgi:hypothetical protein
MFAFTCTACDTHRLVFPSQVRGVANTPHGIEVGFECWCGSRQTMLTGRGAHRQPARAA